MASLMLANMDPVGRLSVVAQGGYGQRGAWRGGSLATTLRLSPIEVETSAWYTEHAPSEQAAGSFASLDIDSRFTGMGWPPVSITTADLGVVAGRGSWPVDGNQLDGAGRTMGFGEVRGRLTWSWRGLTVHPLLHAQVAQGGTGGDSWTRTVTTGSIAVRGGGRSLRADVTVGSTSRRARQFGRVRAVRGGAATSRSWMGRSCRSILPSVPVGYVDKLGIGRVSTELFGLTPYAVWLAAGDKRTRYQRILGAEQEWQFSGLGFARLPETRVRFGVGYSMDDPYKEKIRPYVSVTYRP
jgi:hypothetical protein